VEVIRALLRGERVTHRWHGQETEIEFLDPNGLWYDVSDVPVWMAAGGPRGLKAAAALADAVVYCLGPQPDMIQLVRRELDKAVAEAGRPAGSVKLISLSWFYQLRDGETWEDAITEGFGSGPISSCLTNAGFMNEHVDELGEPIVQASTQAAMAYLGDPGAADRPHYLDTWAKYLRGLDPAHKPLITKQLVDYWCVYGGPGDVREQAQLMLDNGVDLVSVFLSNPFTAERDVNDIGTSILARA
jgi:alkanesulfonate monooxygenase SsuD/methylene tetrahydromethanopterin reductase-like flavin-dependent oxidoreductase (luciferase family)